MSRTDNTRPYSVQREDRSVPGREEFTLLRGRFRNLHHSGGENAISGQAHRLKAAANRRLRRRNNQKLHQAAREGVEYSGELAEKIHPYDTVWYAIWAY